ncbi:MAG: DNA repair protein RecO [Gelidibacter sp.]|nr:DNA repair protein RecO [Gelidibacter sp.]
MLVKTNAIVLSKIKYRDHDLIVKCYTKNRGTVSYLLRGVLKSAKGNSKVAYYQLLSQLQIEERYRANQSLQNITEVKLDVVYKSLHTNVIKSSIVMFLSEILSSVLKEEEENLELYSYLEAALVWLDQDDDFSNFHLLFLLNLTKYLGFYPDTLQTNGTYFNLSTGHFESIKQNHSVSGENLILLKRLLGIKFDELHAVKLSSKQRQSFLSMLLLYFELHLGDFRKPKSLAIFNQVFN